MEGEPTRMFGINCTCITCFVLTRTPPPLNRSLPSPITHVKLAASQNPYFKVIFMSNWSLCVSMNKLHQGVKEEMHTHYFQSSKCSIQHTYGRCTQGEVQILMPTHGGHNK